MSSIKPITRQELAEITQQARTDRIVERVAAGGVAGLGGGRFPTAQKMTSALNCTTLIVNGLQSEPDNQSDIALLLENTATTIAGAGLVAAACGMTQIALVLPTGLDKTLCTNTQKALQQELDWLNSIRPTNCSARQIYLPSDHASGQEHQLAWRLELIHQPSAEERATPLVRLGVLCLNLATCYAIARAVYHAEPLTRRMITVNGSAQWVSFGTPVAKLVSPAWINGRHGGTPANPERAKIDASIFCVNDPPQVAIAPCINCSACRPACPVNLAPDLLFRFMQSEATPNAEVEAEAEAETDLNRCIECGACNAACPSGLWLTQSFRAAKQQKREALIRQQAAAKAKARVDARTSRLQAQKLEREERLQARAGQSERNKRAW